MKKNIVLLIMLCFLFVPMVVNAESTLKMSVTCDKNTLNVGEETECTFYGSGEGNASFNKLGVSAMNLKVVASDNYALSYVDKYSTVNGWYLKGNFDQNIYQFNLNVDKTNVEDTKVFSIKVRANSRAETVKSMVSLQDVNITMNGTTTSVTLDNGFEITVNADPNNKGNNEHNPQTGDNTLIMIGLAGIAALSLGYVSYRKLNLN